MTVVDPRLRTGHMEAFSPSSGQVRIADLIRAVANEYLKATGRKADCAGLGINEWLAMDACEGMFVEDIEVRAMPLEFGIAVWSFSR